jgi:hypothetical protein
VEKSFRKGEIRLKKSMRVGQSETRQSPEDHNRGLYKVRLL